MSYSWRTNDDVLNDLGSVNGRCTGAEHLHRHVVQGERPPPIHREVPDEDEMSYFFGRHGGPSELNAGPDLEGISEMLKMVNNMEEMDDNEPVTMYHNTNTDEIRISKLNPHAGEYVPGVGFLPSRRNKTPSPRKHKTSGPKKTNGNENISEYQLMPKPLPSMFRRKSDKKTEGNNSENLESTVSPSNNVLRNHISQLKSNLLTNGLPTKKSDDIENSHFTNGNLNEIAKDRKPKPNSPINGMRKLEKTDTTSPPSKETNITPDDSSKFKSNILPNGLPKRQIDKSPVSDDSTFTKNKLVEIQNKIKTTVIASTSDNSLQTKRQKNVAIATLLKMGISPQAPQGKPVTLLKPDYFENPPSIENYCKNKDQMEKSSSSSSELDLYTDQDSISKVNGWFNNMESPKPKYQPPEPLLVKQSVTFKKKHNASALSSASSKETKEPNKEIIEKKTFKPSLYASDLLKKYEDNAERAPVNEDIWTKLERELKEKDEKIKQKMLERQNAG